MRPRIMNAAKACLCLPGTPSAHVGCFRGASAPVDDVPAATAAAHHRAVGVTITWLVATAADSRRGALSKVRTKHLATTGAALAGELDDLRRETFVSMMEAADLRNGGDASDWWADRPCVRRVLAEGEMRS
jgi:hypothetical protein